MPPEEVGRRPQPAQHLGRHPPGPDLSAARAAPGQGAGERGERGGGLVAGRGAATGDEQDEGVQRPAGEHGGRDERQQRQRCGGEPQVQGGAPGRAPRRARRRAGDDGGGNDDDAVPGEVGTPAEVEVGGRGTVPVVELRVEAAELLPDVAPHEHARRR